MEPANVQRVSKASSDELLRKFAELDADPPARGTSPPRVSASRLLLTAPIAIRKKKRSRRAISALSARELAASPAEAAGARTRRRRASGGVAEWKSLLPVANRRPPAHASLLRKMGIRRSDDGAPGSIALFLAAAFEKTWRKTVEGASKIFIEKHCQQTHVRLISDAV